MLLFTGNLKVFDFKLNQFCNVLYRYKFIQRIKSNGGLAIVKKPIRMAENIDKNTRFKSRADELIISHIHILEPVRTDLVIYVDL